ncbi:MAG: TRAP transporter large permease subunit [Lachnospiraceae bacterium]|nr:TRAP transporter large permease subunit [Lachnospiraceae bacterium]
MIREAIYFLIMIVVFLLVLMKAKAPVSLSMAAAAIAGALAAGQGFPVRHFVEGTFSYLSTIMIVATAMMFMKTLEKSGALDAIVSVIIRKFYKHPMVLLICLMFVIMLPGMITGASTAAVLSAGAIVAPILLKIGVPPMETAAIVALGAILGKVAPPVNTAAMVIGMGADVPYVGFEGPLLLMTVPLAVFVVLFFGSRYVRAIRYEEIKEELNFEPQEKFGFRLYLPILVLLVLIVCTKFIPVLPDIGMPVIFMVSALISCFTGYRFNPLTAAREGIHDVTPVMGNLMGVGMFIQVMTLIDVRGMIVTYCLIMPPVLRYLALILVIPAFGGVSSLGSATVFGIPFILAFLGHDELIVAAVLSLIAAVGDIMPPSALSGNFAIKIVGIPKYGPFLKKCLPAAAVILLWGLGSILFANPIAALFG